MITNEEAINTLNSLKDYYNDKYEDSYVGFDNEDNEALDKAIKALEQQSCDDECIEKNEPIRRIEVRRNITVDGEDEDDKWIRGYNEGIDDAIACIKSVPPVTPKGVTITDFADRCRECGRINPCEDCISREQTLKAFAEKCGGECACCEYNGSGYDNAENCKLIKSMPSVTPSRPKGKWIHWTDDYKDYVTCSCCEYGEEGEVLLSDKTPFCPNCGADMRGEGK